MTPPLDRALGELVRLGVIPGAAAELRRSVEQVEIALREAILSEVAAFTETRNPQVLPDLKAHGAAQVAEVLRLYESGEAGDLAFVKSHARRRADQRFPLEALLHAYRCGHRTLSRWLRDAAAATCAKDSAAIDATADFVLEYTNAVSSVIAAEYVAHTRIVEAAERDRGAELLDLLLGGYDESDGRIARLLKAAGYLDQRQSYCVVAVRAPIASEMENPERARRVQTALAELFAPTNIRMLAGPRGVRVVAVVSALRRQSGWTAPQSALAGRLMPLLLRLSPSVLVGLSSDRPSTASIPRALREAVAALDFASVDRRVVAFADLPVRSLLVHAGGEYVRGVAPAWVAELLGADAKAGGALASTLSALAEADLNVQKAGRALGVHANTVYARLQRILDLTGLDGQRHHQLVELLLALECARI